MVIGCNIQPDEINLATLPASPQNLTVAVDSPYQTTLNWDLPLDDGGKEVLGYRIYRRGGDDINFKIIYDNKQSLETSFVDTELSPGTTYTYFVVAITVVGAGSFSNEVDVTTDAIRADPPEDLNELLVSRAKIRFEWSAPDYDGGASISSYLVERRTPDDIDFVPLALIDSDDNLFYEDNDVSPLILYEYRVSAQNSVGLSLPSEVLEIKTGCPQHFSLVAGNVLYSTEDFCVMKYEAKEHHEGGSVEVRPLDLGPWTGRTLSQAKADCLDLGDRYDLISNNEWMTLAREVEMVESNWGGGDIGKNCLKQGNIGLDGDCGIDEGGDVINGNEEGRNLRARHELLSGDYVWDISGNVWQWVDWTTGGSVAQEVTINCSAGTYELSDNLSCTGLLDSNFLPENPTLQEPNEYDSRLGLGRIIIDNSGEQTYSVLRGGSATSEEDAGAFALRFTLDSSDPSYGFRCVFR